MKPANTKPCESCPWLVENHGKRHPHGWFTRANRRRLWAGLRRAVSDGMSCHRTDADNPVPEGTLRPTCSEAQECAGSLLLVQRELREFERLGLDCYFKVRKHGLTRKGAAYWGITRAAFAGVPFVGGKQMTAIPEDDRIAHGFEDQT